ncbi:uncharacterized protein DDB_G0273701/DDB_G0273221 [Aspergillus awamori]|uniref:Uncharacterized protein DDB_G0273701/DDB_G0273221 n=1 Tax=Aspergillus awamori TaxID=105351 RepID=A0A401L675_ASPAW|nr:uncharacterized protein DDB_G0273701/DDB_G0273221 [Aspergillus awamori]
MSSDQTASYLPAPNNVQPTKGPRYKRKYLVSILLGTISLVAIIVAVVCLSVLLPKKLKHDNNHDGGSHNTGVSTTQGNDTYPMDPDGNTYDGGGFQNGTGTHTTGATPTGDVPHQPGATSNGEDSQWPNGVVNVTDTQPVQGGSQSQDGECHVVSKVSYTFYGYPDNDPPGSDISEDCGRGMAAGGIGTHENPLTFATAPGEFDRCEVVYSPYLQKYLINEDYCEQCTKDWKSHIWHVDVWLGGNSTTYGTEQLKCENSLTSAEESQVVIKNPSSNLPVDREFLYMLMLSSL